MGNEIPAVTKPYDIIMWLMPQVEKFPRDYKFTLGDRITNSHWYDEDYYKNSPKNNPRGPDSGQYRVLRGGSGGNGSWTTRAADRFGVVPETWRGGGNGFRLVSPAP